MEQPFLRLTIPGASALAIAALLAGSPVARTLSTPLLAALVVTGFALAATCAVAAWRASTRRHVPPLGVGVYAIVASVLVATSPPSLAIALHAGFLVLVLASVLPATAVYLRESREREVPIRG